MSGHRTPVALSSLTSIDFLGWLLDHHQEPTTLIICLSREVYLSNVQNDLRRNHPEGPSAISNDSDSIPLHPLLKPTIHLTAKSRSIHLVFVPTFHHLRAYLSTHMLPTNSDSPRFGSANAGAQIPILAIWGLLHAHRSTAEYSAQGLSRTLAAAVESASLAEQTLVLAEPKVMDSEEQYEGSEAIQGLSGDPWKEQVPLLSGSIKFGSEDRSWAGKTIETGCIVAKWCKFVNLGNLDHDT